MERRHRRWLKGKARVQGLGRRLRQARGHEVCHGPGSARRATAVTVWRSSIGMVT